jgi:DNA repair protein RadC
MKEYYYSLNINNMKNIVTEEIYSYKIIKNKKDTTFESKTISSSKDAYDFIKKFYYEDIDVYESFFILCLNRKNDTIGYMKISQGGRHTTVVDPTIIAKYTIDIMASGVILCHNHPSGNLKPSQTDIDLTNKINNGLQFLDILLLDHLIITNNHYYSFKDEGKI